MTEQHAATTSYAAFNQLNVAYQQLDTYTDTTLWRIAALQTLAEAEWLASAQTAPQHIREACGWMVFMLRGQITRSFAGHAQACDCGCLSDI